MMQHTRVMTCDYTWHISCQKSTLGRIRFFMWRSTLILMVNGHIPCQWSSGGRTRLFNMVPNVMWPCVTRWCISPMGTDEMMLLFHLDLIAPLQMDISSRSPLHSLTPFQPPSYGTGWTRYGQFRDIRRSPLTISDNDNDLRAFPCSRSRLRFAFETTVFVAGP